MKKPPTFVQKREKQNRKTFVYAYGRKGYVENKQIIVIEEKSFKTLTGNGGRKSEDFIDGKNFQTLAELVRGKVDKFY